jgi:hypothetical protein
MIDPSPKKIAKVVRRIPSLVLATIKLLPTLPIIENAYVRLNIFTIIMVVD